MNIFYQPRQEKYVTRGNLPHWTQYGKMHFVTFRLSDSLPQEKLKQIQKQRQEWNISHQHPLTDDERHAYHRLFTARMNQWLDAGHGECLFAKYRYADIVADALNYFEKERYFLDHWVVMPNHVHVLFIPIKPHTLKEILHSWKSFTSREMNKHRRRSGNVWQHESFDHIVRSQKQLEKYRHYIIDNWEQANKQAIVSTKKVNLPLLNKYLDRKD